MVEELAENRTRNDKKLVKLLARLRKKAGRVRDLDVEIAVLRSLKVPEEPVRKSQLMRALAEERAVREKRLVKALDQKAFADLRKRLKRTAGSLRFSKNANPLAIAMQKIAELDFDPGSMTNATLHCFRIAGKRARYVAEMAGKSAEGAAFVEQLNRMQDALGDWHLSTCRMLLAIGMTGLNWPKERESDLAEWRILRWWPYFGTLLVPNTVMR